MIFRGEPAATLTEDLVVDDTPVILGVAAGVDVEEDGPAVPFPCVKEVEVAQNVGEVAARWRPWL